MKFTSVKTDKCPCIYFISRYESNHGRCIFNLTVTHTLNADVMQVFSSKRNSKMHTKNQVTWVNTGNEMCYPKQKKKIFISIVETHNTCNIFIIVKQLNQFWPPHGILKDFTCNSWYSVIWFACIYLLWRSKCSFFYDRIGIYVFNMYYKTRCHR